MSDEALHELGAYVSAKQPDAVLDASVAFGELTLSVTAANLPALVRFLKMDETCKFSSLVDITAVDHPERRARFDVVYHFLSMYRNQRIRLKAAVREDEMAPSIVADMTSNRKSGRKAPLMSRASARPKSPSRERS